MITNIATKPLKEETIAAILLDNSEDIVKIRKCMSNKVTRILCLWVNTTIQPLCNIQIITQIFYHTEVIQFRDSKSKLHIPK